jgi:transcriptional repressor NrdR
MPLLPEKVHDLREQERVPLIVIKKDGSRQTLTKENFKRMLRACEKRPVALADLQKAVYEIEQELQNSLEREIDSAAIGELTMRKSRARRGRLRPVCLRLQTVQGLNTFMDELNKLLKDK